MLPDLDRYTIEQKALAVSYSLIGAAVAGRIVLAWLDRRIDGAVRWVS